VLDVAVVRSGSWRQAMLIAKPGAELLEGLSFTGCPGFEAWLTAERRHLHSVVGAVLHESVLARLTAGQTDQAVATTAQLVAANPYDEELPELYVRCLLAAGDRLGAKAGRPPCAICETVIEQGDKFRVSHLWEAVVHPFCVQAWVGRPAQVDLDRGVCSFYPDRCPIPFWGRYCVCPALAGCNEVIVARRFGQSTVKVATYTTPAETGGLPVASRTWSRWPAGPGSAPSTTACRPVRIRLSTPSASTACPPRGSIRRALRRCSTSRPRGTPHLGT